MQELSFLGLSVQILQPEDTHTHTLKIILATSTGGKDHWPAHFYLGSYHGVTYCHSQGKGSDECHIHNTQHTHG